MNNNANKENKPDKSNKNKINKKRKMFKPVPPHKNMTKLGSGGFGIVYKTMINGKTLVLKEMNKRRTTEAKILAEVGIMSVLKKFVMNIFCALMIFSKIKKIFIFYLSI